MGLRFFSIHQATAWIAGVQDIAGLPAGARTEFGLPEDRTPSTPSQMTALMPVTGTLTADPETLAGYCSGSDALAHRQRAPLPAGIVMGRRDATDEARGAVHDVWGAPLVRPVTQGFAGLFAAAPRLSVGRVRAGHRKQVAGDVLAGVNIIPLPDHYRSIMCGHGYTIQTLIERFEYLARHVVGTGQDAITLIHTRNNLIKRMQEIGDAAAVQHFIDQMVQSLDADPLIAVLGLAHDKQGGTWNAEHVLENPSRCFWHVKDSFKRYHDIITSDRRRFLPLDTTDPAVLKTLRDGIVDMVLLTVNRRAERYEKVDYRETGRIAHQRFPEIIRIPPRWEAVARQCFGDDTQGYKAWRDTARFAIATRGVKWLHENYLARASDNNGYMFLILSLGGGSRGWRFWDTGFMGSRKFANELATRRRHYLRVLEHISTLIQGEGLETDGGCCVHRLKGFIAAQLITRHIGYCHKDWVESQVRIFLNPKATPPLEGAMAAVEIPANYTGLVFAGVTLGEMSRELSLMDYERSVILAGNLERLGSCSDVQTVFDSLCVAHPRIAFMALAWAEDLATVPVAVERMNRKYDALRQGVIRRIPGQYRHHRMALERETLAAVYVNQRQGPVQLRDDIQSIVSKIRRARHDDVNRGEGGLRMRGGISLPNPMPRIELKAGIERLVRFTGVDRESLERLIGAIDRENRREWQTPGTVKTIPVCFARMGQYGQDARDKALGLAMDSLATLIEAGFVKSVQGLFAEALKTCCQLQSTGPLHDILARALEMRVVTPPPSLPIFYVWLRRYIMEVIGVTDAAQNERLNFLSRGVRRYRGAVRERLTDLVGPQSSGAPLMDVVKGIAALSRLDWRPCWDAVRQVEEINEASWASETPGAPLPEFFEQQRAEEPDDQDEAVRLALVMIHRECAAGGPVAMALAERLREYAADPAGLHRILDLALGFALNKISREQMLQRLDALGQTLQGELKVSVRAIDEPARTEHIEDRRQAGGTDVPDDFAERARKSVAAVRERLETLSSITPDFLSDDPWLRGYLDTFLAPPPMTTRADLVAIEKTIHDLLQKRRLADPLIEAARKMRVLRLCVRAVSLLDGYGLSLSVAADPALAWAGQQITDENVAERTAALVRVQEQQTQRMTNAVKVMQKEAVQQIAQEAYHTGFEAQEMQAEIVEMLTPMERLLRSLPSEIMDGTGFFSMVLTRLETFKVDLEGYGKTLPKGVLAVFWAELSALQRIVEVLKKTDAFMMRDEKHQAARGALITAIAKAETLTEVDKLLADAPQEPVPVTRRSR
ncbi:MAG: hypothetical protein HQM16_05800 [Deltaproteobacteria bacterium]|nr:hypothetical protein [Deltaproteobacteria bacterium]